MHSRTMATTSVFKIQGWEWACWVNLGNSPASLQLPLGRQEPGLKTYQARQGCCTPQLLCGLGLGAGQDGPGCSTHWYVGEPRKDVGHTQLD